MIETVKRYLKLDRVLSFGAAIFGLWAAVLVLGFLLQPKPAETRPQSALVPTLQYLTTADRKSTRLNSSHG